MSQRFFTYYVEQEKYQEYLRTRKPLDLSYTPFLKFEPIQHYDAYSFRAFFLEKEYLADYRESKNWEYVCEHHATTRSYCIDFKKHKDVFITNDGVSFYKLLDYRIDEHKRIEFHLRQVRNAVFTELNKCFMIMPFGNTRLNAFYKSDIRDFLRTSGLTVMRADDFTDSDVIIDTIFQQIEQAEFVLCEITECNKNVFFEIGYAKALQKNLIFLLQRGTEHKFFDVSHIRRIEYDLDNPAEFQTRLVDTIRTIRGKAGRETY